MKTSGVCPKCQHNQILHITQVADRIGDFGGRKIEQGPQSVAEVGDFHPWRIARLCNTKPKTGFFVSLGESEVMAAGLVEAFICRRCGLTELYTRDPDQIEVDGQLVREISGPPRQGPFR
jgi:predicted nucleic-acid-binding Zn-ribbon protein